MRRYARFFPVILAALALVSSGSTTFLRQASAQQGSAQKGGAQKGDAQMSVAAQRQISALLQEKNSRTPAQKKINSQLLYAMKERRGEKMTSGGEVSTLRSAMSMAKPDNEDRVLVNIKADASKQLLMTIENLRGEVKYASAKAGLIRALLPLNSLEELAGASDVQCISPAAFEATTHPQAPG